jgi:hypothetical protein
LQISMWQTAVPHAPQFFGSVLVSVHTPAHSVPGHVEGVSVGGVSPGGGVVSVPPPPVSVGGVVSPPPLVSLFVAVSLLLPSPPEAVSLTGVPVSLPSSVKSAFDDPQPTTTIATRGRRKEREEKVMRRA